MIKSVRILLPARPADDDDRAAATGVEALRLAAAVRSVGLWPPPGSPVARD